MLGRSGAGTPLLGTAPVRSRGGHGAHGPPRRPGGPAPWCSEWRRGHGAAPPRDCGRLGRDALPPAERRRCPPPGLGGEHGAVAPGVLHVQMEGRGRPGEVRQRMAPLGGGAVSRGGDAAPAATTRRAAGSARGTPGRCGEAGSKGSAQAATQEEPPTSVWQLCQHTVRAAALRRRPSHGAPWIEGDQRLPLVSTGWSWPLLVVSRQALPARPPPTSTPGTSWTTFSGTMGLIQLNGTRQWPRWPALCEEAKRGLSHRPRRGPGRSRCTRVPVLRGGQGASQSAAQHGAGGSAAQRRATTSTGSAGASTSSGGAAGATTASAGSKPAAATSSGDPRG